MQHIFSSCNFFLKTLWLLPACNIMKKPLAIKDTWFFFSKLSLHISCIWHLPLLAVQLNFFPLEMYIVYLVLSLVHGFDHTWCVKGCHFYTIFSLPVLCLCQPLWSCWWFVHNRSLKPMQFKLWLSLRNFLISNQDV